MNSDDYVWCEAVNYPEWCNRHGLFGKPVCDRWNCPGKIEQEAKADAKKHLDWFFRKVKEPRT